MTRRTRLVLLAAAVTLGGAWVLLLLPAKHEVGTAVSSAPPPPSASTAAPRPSSPAAEVSHLADALNSPATDIAADLHLLDDLFATFRTNLRENPIGTNAEITAALTGHNSLHLPLIPHDHPAINARGELCDRWGTPFFFHQLSGTQMEIRSAGPDKKLWTADDTVFTP